MVQSQSRNLGVAVSVGDLWKLSSNVVKLFVDLVFEQSLSEVNVELWIDVVGRRPLEIFVVTLNEKDRTKIENNDERKPNIGSRVLFVRSLSELIDDEVEQADERRLSRR